MDGQDFKIKQIFLDFLTEHKINENLGCIDDTLLNYILSVLEDIRADKNPEENIDLDQFIEMMSAYIPGFSNIHRSKVYEWIFGVASQFSSNGQQMVKIENDFESPNKSHNINKNIKSRTRKKSDSVSDKTTISTNSSKKKSEPGDINLLLEMFPKSCNIEVKNCLFLCTGDLEKAAQLILERQESGQCLQQTVKESKNVTNQKITEQDRAVKDNVLNKYSFLDTEEDEKTYRPKLQKHEPKKMIRYLDGKVVNTKGQRFTDIKPPEDEEVKKTYVSLKPARKYRFH